MSAENRLELEAIEAAVAGERSDPVLALVVEEARAAAPRMTPAFAQRLDAAVAQGFARPSAPRRRLRLKPALGLAAATAMAVAIAVAVIPGGGSRPQSLVAPQRSAPGATAAPSEGLAAPKAVAPSRTAPAQSDAALAPSPRGRVQEHSAELTLSTPSNRLQDTADQVVAVTDRVGGYVQSSNVAARDNAGEATFDLRVPASRLDEAMAALSRLGHVRGRSEQVQDITFSYDSAKARLRDAEAEREGLLRALAGATTTQQIESIKARLRLVRAKIAAASRELSSVRHRARYSHVAVTLLGTAHHGATPHRGGGAWTPGRALHDAGRVLSVAAGVLIVAAAGAVPVGLLALLALLAARAVRRRRRESALDGTAPAV